MINNQIIVSDFSFWQDDDYTPYKIDFKRAYEAGLDGTILRAGQNAWVDEDFLDYCKNADLAGLPRGAYWFFDSRVSPVPQADLFADTVEKAGEFPKLGIWGDYEENYGGVYGGQKNFRIFMERLETRFPGKLIGVYTGPSYWREHTNLMGASFFQKYPLWIAHYRVYEPDVPFPWGKNAWTFWQFTEQGDGPKFGAESKEIDMNYFGGTLEDYRRIFNIPNYEPSTPPEEPGDNMKIYKVLATTTPYANLRATPNGTDIGDVYPGTEFSSDREELDTLGRPWLHSTSPEGFILKSLCAFVGEATDPEPTEPHVLEVFIDGVLEFRKEF